ncbi:sigma-54-dependent transcriptional regulator [Mariniblastus fucicola]|uniref:DNA-binding transcriptional regulator NtrC n=1 Tax=Mariniblastus fucicola TaxID=980251 RepID=A0A5B9P642_9BACT|nr:sigma-54 dependent transcriptional regulator [Mariniblastus fucicola]QEG20390.1 Nitrogen regulation protein NR(I) [Mariniblastus fucicola]
MPDQSPGDLCLLVVDDEPAIAALFKHVFADSEISVLSAGTASAALELIQSAKPDAVMLDVVLPDADGLQLFETVKQIDPQLPVVIMTGGQDGQTAISAMQQGAMDYLVKPLDVRSLNKVVRHAMEVRRLMVEPVSIERADSNRTGSSMIGCSPAMQEVFKAIGRVAAQNISVLIRGESGTGKELVARAIFQNGLRKEKPFIAINCAAIPEALLESELFGHEKGAFTGADRKRIGKIEQCEGGTLFLDEIGDMEAPLQSKLLRVLQEKQFERVGGSETISADVRILAATHQGIEKMCESGKFREDLYYRLNGYTISLPPLRERDGDIELLIEFFRQTANEELGKEIGRIAPEAISTLKKYSWPGNVRQLQSVIHQAIVQSSGSVLLPDFLPPLIERESSQPVLPTAAVDTTDAEPASHSTEPVAETQSVSELIARHCSHHSATLYDDVIEEVERELIATVLNKCGGNLTEAARQLGITRTTVRSKVNKLGIGIRKVVE